MPPPARRSPIFPMIASGFSPELIGTSHFAAESKAMTPMRSMGSSRSTTSAAAILAISIFCPLIDELTSIAIETWIGRFVVVVASLMSVPGAISVR